ncbi:hypothetical protein PR048_012520 [Dryococelus australis]|uniref:Uncharacterized protein n=1 Tax=Dryococelus australis TaxID=614101 RepID=A0ABQ9HPM2_9NEOP|nr:hypothetical protein PR048_012520 [Dryococelus australis]
MRVIEVSKEQRRKEGAGKTGDPLENPSISAIVWHNIVTCENPGVSSPGIEPCSPRSVGRCHGDLPFPPPLHSNPAPYSTYFALIDSQDLNFKSRPNLFTRSLITGLEQCAIARHPVIPRSGKKQPPTNTHFLPTEDSSHVASAPPFFLLPHLLIHSPGSRPDVPALELASIQRPSRPLHPLVHTVFDSSWRMLSQSSPSAVTADNQRAVNIGIFVHKFVVSSLQSVIVHDHGQCSRQVGTQKTKACTVLYNFREPRESCDASIGDNERRGTEKETGKEGSPHGESLLEGSHAAGIIGRGKQEIQRKPADQRNRLARFPDAKIREWPGWGLDPVRCGGRRAGLPLSHRRHHEERIDISEAIKVPAVLSVVLTAVGLLTAVPAVLSAVLTVVPAILTAVLYAVLTAVPVVPTIVPAVLTTC